MMMDDDDEKDLAKRFDEKDEENKQKMTLAQKILAKMDPDQERRESYFKKHGSA